MALHVARCHEGHLVITGVFSPPRYSESRFELSRSWCPGPFASRVPGAPPIGLRASPSRQGSGRPPTPAPSALGAFHRPPSAPTLQGRALTSHRQDRCVDLTVFPRRALYTLAWLGSSTIPSPK